MEPGSVVDLLDERPDAGLGLGQVAVGSAIHLFGLQRLHEALSLGVVGGTAATAHGGDDAGVLKPAGVVAAGILHAAIRVVDEFARRRLAGADRHVGKGRLTRRVALVPMVEALRLTLTRTRRLPRFRALTKD